MNAAFFDDVRASLYAGALNQTQVDSLNAIGQAFGQYGDGDPRKLAYILATAHHETGGFKWLREIWGPTKAQRGYEGRADLGNTVPGDGRKFAGRGFVQLTGRRNYADWSKRTGIDLLKEPDMVMEPAVAARILVQGSMLGTFTGKKLGDYHLFTDMRRVINGTDKAAMIAGYAETFLAALAGAHQPAPATQAPPISPIPVVPMPELPVKPSGNAPWIFAAVLFLIALGAVFFIRF